MTISNTTSPSGWGDIVGIRPVSYATAPVTLTLGGTGNILIKANVKDNTTAINLTLAYTGTGTLFLATNNTYTGSTTISSGTLALTNSGTLGTTPSIILNAGATLDASAQTNFVLSTTNVLYVSGTGTNVGSTAAAFKAGTNGTVNFGSRPIIMTYNGVNPALYVSQGTLSVSNNPFIINTVSLLPLTNGTYAIAQQASGNINTNTANAYTISGTALSAGSTSSIFASNNVLWLKITNASTNAAPITGLSPTKFWWLGVNNAGFATAASWSTSSNSVVSSGYPAATPAQNNIGIFNYPATNSVTETVSISDAAYTFGGLIINNSNSTKFVNVGIDGASFTLNGFTNDSSGTLYGIVLNTGAGATSFYMTNDSTYGLPIVVNRSQTWLNNSASLLSISNTVSILSGTNLTLGGSGNIYFVSNIIGAGSLTVNSLGTTYLGTSNSYAGGTTILMGTLALTGTGRLGNGGVINVDAGGILDVSGTTFNLGTSNTLAANGTGTGVGSTAATIKGAANGTVNLGSQPVQLTYDGFHPALYISQGQASFFTNTFGINTVSGQPLTNGMYAIVQQASGSIGAAGPFTISGSAIPSGATTSIVASNNVLYLTINTSYSNGTFTNPIHSYPSGVTITSGPTNSLNNGNSGQPNYYYIGVTNGANVFTGSLWVNTDTNSAPLVSSANGANAVDIFNVSATNNTPVVVAPSGLISFAGLIFNNSNSVTMNSSAAEFSMYGFTNSSSSLGGYAGNPYGLLYGLVANPNAGPVTFSNTCFDISSQNQIWVNNGVGTWNFISGRAPNGDSSGLHPNVSIYGSGPANANQNLTFAGSGNIAIYGQIIEIRSQSVYLGLTYSGAGTLFLGCPSNSYSLGTTINSGTVALTNGGSLGGGQLMIAAGATLDVSGLGSGVFSLMSTNTYVTSQPGPNGGNNLVVSGIGTGVGTTAATIIGAVNGTVNLGSQSVTMTYDGSHPALYVPQGTLRLAGNPITINTASGQPLTNGTYVIAQQGYGSISSGGGYTIYGTALSVGATASITASNNVLLLNISNASGVVAGITPGSSLGSYYYNGAASGSVGGSYWYPTDSTNGSLGVIADNKYAVATLNISATNNVNEAINLNTFNNYGGLIINNTGTTKVTNIYAAPYGFTNGAGTIYGVVVNAGAGAVTIGSPGDSTFLGVTGNPFQSQTWVNNSTSLLTISAGLQQGIQNSSVSLAFAGTGNILVNGPLFEYDTSNRRLNVAYAGSGTLFLKATNTYTLGTTISSGTVALTNNGTLGTGGLYIGAGATLDVSGLTTNNFSLGSSNALVANSVNSTSFTTIKGKSGGTVSLGSSTVTLNYDGSDPAINVSQGTLVLSNNTFIINTPGNIPLSTNKTYILAQQTTGNISVTSNNFSAYGSAFTPGYTYSIYVVNNTLVLSFGLSYWDATSTNWQSTGSWSTLPSSTLPNPSAVPGIYDIPIFNITPSNNVAQTVSLNGNVTIAGMIFNNSNSTAINGGNGAYSLSTANSGVTVNPGGGSVTFGSANPSQAVTNLISASQTWLNNGTGTVSVLNALSSAGTNSATLTLGGTGNFNFSGAITTNGTGILSLDYNGSGTLTLGSSNLFKGGLTVEQGVVKTTASSGINNAFGSSSTVTLGNIQNSSTNLNARISLATGTYTNGFVLSPNPAGDLILGMQPGSTVNLTGGVTGTNDLVIYESTTGILNFSNQPINNVGSFTVAPNTADANAGPTTSTTYVYTYIGTNVTAVTVTTNGPAGTNLLVLNGTNTYTGTTTIGGTLALGTNGSIASSTNIAIGAGGVFNVSAINNFTLSATNTLTATGTNGQSATIIGATNGTVSLGSSAVTLNFDGTTPALNVASGTLALNGNPFTINSATPLDYGQYVIAQSTAGITGNGPFTVNGTALSPGSTGTISIVGNQLILTVVTPPVTYPGGTNSLNGPTGESGLIFTNGGGTTLNGGTMNSDLTVGKGGITVAPGAGAVTIGSTNNGQKVNVLLDGSQTWTNNGTGDLTLLNQLSNANTNPATLTLVGTNGFNFAGPVVDGNGPLGIVQDTTDTLTLSPSNTFSGGVMVDQGTVMTGNAASATNVNSAFGSNPVIILGDANANTNPASLNLGTGIVTNGIVLAPGTTGDLTVGAGTNANAIVTGGVTGTNDLVLAGNPGGTLTISGNPVNNKGTVTVDGNGGTVVVNSTVGTNVTALTVDAPSGTNVLVLNGTNLYTGTTTIGGTLALGTNGSITASTNIVIAADGIFDVSAVTNFALGTNQTLTATGTNGQSATIVGATNGTVSLGSSSITLNYDGTAPSLEVASGTLVLNTNPFTINTPAPLGYGQYVIAESTDGITGTGPFTVNGSAIGAGSTGTISIVGNQVILTVVTPAATYPGGTNSLDGPTSESGLVFTNGGGTTLNGGTTNSDLTVGNGGITVTPGAGPVTIGSTNDGQNVNVLVDGSQTWTNNGTTDLTVLNGISNATTNPATLTLTGTNGFDLAGPVTDGNGPLGIVQDTTGTLTLNPTNSFSGGVVVDQGTVATGNAASATNVNSAFGSNPTIILGDANANTNPASLNLGTGIVTNGIVLAPGTTGDLTVGAGTNANATVTGGVTGTNDLVLAGNPGGTLTVSGGPVNNKGAVTVDGNGGTVVVNSAIGTNVTAVTVDAPAGTNVLVLSGTNTYTGTTTIGGTLALTNNGSLASTNIVIDGGGTLDASGLNSPLTLGTNQTLTSAAPTGGVIGDVNLGSGQLVLNVNSTNGAPSLTIGDGTLTFTTNTAVQINNTGSPLPAGSYPLIATNAGGAIAGTLPTVTIGGNGLAPNTTSTLQVINGQLYLVVSSLSPVAQTMTLVVTKNLTLKIALADIATNWSAGSGSPLHLAALSATSTNGVSLKLSTNNGVVYLLYNSKVTVIDQISYTVGDTNGLTAPGLINIIPNNLVYGQVNTLSVSGSTATVNFAGIPGYTYSVQVSTNLSTWTTLTTTNAPTGGAFQFIDTNAPQPAAFYRLMWSGN